MEGDDNCMNYYERKEVRATETLRMLGYTSLAVFMTWVVLQFLWMVLRLLNPVMAYFIQGAT